jgi:cell division protein FtsW (lipid II flippase)
VSVTEPERPKAPWHPFPLVELLVLAGIVLLVLGFLSFDSDRGKAMLVGGMLLGSLGGLDTALREHFSGYRSHTTIIAGVLAVALAAVLYFAGAPWIAVVGGALVAFAGAAWLLVRDYKRRER